MDAARIATKARARVIEMGSIGGSALDPACFSAYNDTMVAALEGYLPASVAAARKLDAEREKLMRYAMAVLKTAAAAKDGPAATLEAERQANQEIRAYFGGGSVVSAAQYMTGKRATDLIARVLDGEIACDSDLSPERLVFAAVFSRAFVEGRA